MQILQHNILSFAHTDEQLQTVEKAYIPLTQSPQIIPRSSTIPPQWIDKFRAKEQTKSITHGGKMSRKGPFIVIRVIGFLLLTALVTGGIFMAFKAGETQGISQAPAVATAISQAAENGQVAPVPPMMYGHGYGYPMYGHHHFGFFPFGAVCGSIFFLFFFFGFMKMIFFRRMRHGWGHHGHWGKDWEGGVSSKFDEWHKRAHVEKPAEEDKKE